MFIQTRYWSVAALLVINFTPYVILFFRLIRILIYEAGQSENPYPGPGDPLGLEFVVDLFLFSIAISTIPILFLRQSLWVKALIFLGVVVGHVLGYLSFIVFAFAASGAVTGRSL